MFEKIINLTAYVQDAKKGQFSSELQIRKEFNGLVSLVHEYKNKTLCAFREMNSCEHREYDTPKWYLKKNILNYYYEFTKTCKHCGHTESLVLDKWNERDFPEGYEGAQKQYWNLNI